ncbi:MAG: hypothetical protein GX558_05100, partial [Clostridiales bacterium]|nr:hypothetical protein [Clostridiales bacterium]
MQREPIAIITDSSCDLPAEFVEAQENLYILPLQLIYPEGNYRDGVEIDAIAVYDRMEKG